LTNVSVEEAAGIDISRALTFVDDWPALPLN
jgi:hypothetical protein